MKPRCVADVAKDLSGQSDIDPPKEGVTDFKNVQWSADGTCLVATANSNDIHTFVVPSDLLDDKATPLSLSSYCAIASPEPVNSVVAFPSFQLQNAATALILSSVREHPIRLNSALNGHLIASYPLVNPMTEEYISPHSLAFDPTFTRFIAGSDSLISVFDISRPGQQPFFAVPTGPKNRNDDRWNPATSMRGIVSALGVEPASTILAAGTFNRNVALYESAGQGECIGSFSLEGNEADQEIGGRGITQMHWSPCGRYLYVVERKSDGIMIYDIRKTGQLLSWVEGRHANTNQRLGVEVAHNSIDGSYEVWAGGTDGKVRMWKDVHLQEGAVKPDFDFLAHEDAVTSVVLHHAGGVLATSSGQQRRVDEDKALLVDEARLKIWTI